MKRIRVRPGAPEDAEAVARMANALNRELGLPGDPFTRDRVVEDGFGAVPRFALLIADVDGVAAGYAMYHAAYDSDIAAPAVHLVDLYVSEDARRLGVGRALMGSVAREALRAGARTLDWGVHEANATAIAFYRALGAAGGSVRLMEVKDGALEALAVPATDAAMMPATADREIEERRPGSGPEP
jgi:GNAT superfamily N-acetyltransferase